MKWFSNPQTLEQLKKQYKKLAMQHHPDMGGSVSNMQEINAEYDRLFEVLKNTHQTVDGKTYTAKTETTETASEFKEIINRIINLQNITIEICGSWIWITGDTYQHREILKGLKFRFSKSKTAWYYHNEGYRKNHNKIYSLDEIRDLYGSETVTSNSKLQLQVV
jgi:curved DNA-binding protein CbpA